jgi:hypothetical protein
MPAGYRFMQKFSALTTTATPPLRGPSAGAIRGNYTQSPTH